MKLPNTIVCFLYEYDSVVVGMDCVIAMIMFPGYVCFCYEA